MKEQQKLVQRTAIVPASFIQLCLVSLILIGQSPGPACGGEKYERGLVGSYYNRPDLTRLKYVTIIESLDQKWTRETSPGKDWSAQWQGYIVSPVDGEVTFRLETDAAAVLEIDGKKIAEVQQGETADSGNLALRQSRKTPIRLKYMHYTGYEGYLTVKWSWYGQGPIAVSGRHLLHEASEKKSAEMLFKQASENIEKYRKGDATILLKDENGKPVRDAKVEVDQINSDFLFGCIAFSLVPGPRSDLYKPELFKERILGLFNCVVLPFYWKGYEPQAGMPKWEANTEVLKWCGAHDIAVKGHPLAWTHPAGVPDWILDFGVEVSEDLLQGRIINVVHGFKDQVKIWDVVNEPVHTKPWKAVSRSTVDDQRYVEVPIQERADWVERCYRSAYAANPEAHLVLNEYGVIVDLDARQRFYDLVTELKRRGTPISGLGVQAHEPRQQWYSPHELWDTLELFAEFGYPIHITEFTPQSSGLAITGLWRQGTWTEGAQAEFAEQMYRLCFGHPAVASIIWWGLSDRYIWLKNGGSIDEEYRPKPVYERLRRLIRTEWRTAQISALTDDSGKIKFRGFYGNYVLRVTTQDGTIQTFNIHLSKGGTNEWEFQLR